MFISIICCGLLLFGFIHKKPGCRLAGWSQIKLNLSSIIGTPTMDQQPMFTECRC
jgi:hypothetical protein